jgi:signal transduction histidine kinase
MLSRVVNAPALSPLAGASPLRQDGSLAMHSYQKLHVLHLVQGSLHAKYILIMVSLVVILMGAVTFLQEGHQRRAILEQTRLRAIALGTSLAALSEGYILSYNFAKLEQVTEHIVDSNDDVVYAVAHLRDGKVATYSDRNDLQGKMLDDAVSQQALQAKQALVQSINIPGQHAPGYDVAIPVYVAGSSQKWGTIRLGFSLKRAYTMIGETRRNLVLLGLLATCGSLVLAVMLATRISRPIGHLVSAVGAITRGSYDHPIHVDAQDEIGYLAATFEQMRLAVQEHIVGLDAEQMRLQEANTRLKETQQQIVHLAARVAHEVNNPLAVIKTAIRIVSKHSQKDELAHTNLQVMEEEINRVARIIQELLAFSRPIHPQQTVEVNMVLHNLQSVLEYSLHEKHIALDMVLEPELPHVHLSADHLKQVILNLVRNAEDSMPDGGQLVIETARHEKGIVIRISDTGCGISEEFLGRLFDPFFTTKETERGMGLGLAVSFGIIRRANGNIEVESEVGHGTTFRIVLPEYIAGEVAHSVHEDARKGAHL